MSRRKPAPREAKLNLTARTVPAASAWDCPACRAPLDLHQPDAADPDRILGTCADCGVWALVQLDPSGGAAHVLELPTAAALARALAAPFRAAALALPGLEPPTAAALPIAHGA